MRRAPRKKGASRPVRLATILTGRAALRAMIAPAAQHTVTIHKMSAESVISQASAATLTTLYFTLAQCDFTDFRNAFQQYTITKVQVWFRPYFKANPASLDATYFSQRSTSLLIQLTRRAGPPLQMRNVPRTAR